MPKPRPALFKWRHFEPAIILCAVRWYFAIFCVINIDGNPSYSKVIAELKEERKLGRRCRCRTCPYLNNNLEQDHRAIKRRVHASQGFRSFDGAWRTIQGYEVLHMIRKGQVRLPKGDVVGQVLFVNETFGLKAAKSPWE